MGSCRYAGARGLIEGVFFNELLETGPSTEHGAWIRLGRPASEL